MSSRTWLIPIAAAAIAGAAWWQFTPHASSRTGMPTAAPAQAVDAARASATDDDIRTRNIAFYERRIGEDPNGAADRSLLAALYMQRARATGDYTDYARAERLARRSLALRVAHNSQTFSLLASALLARHAFAEALDVARRADSLYPEVPANLALLGEIELETGDYAAANAHFSAIHFDGEQFTIAARIARWRELTGRADAARRLLQGAALRADRRDDLPREQVAWFHYRLGELELRTGRLDAADSAFRRGLAIFPSDYRILGGLARLAAARRRWRESIDYGDKAIAVQLDPATLGTISDAYAALGDSAQAEQYARTMTISALRQPGPIHRAWGLFLLDRGDRRDVARVLVKTRVELRTRHDVYGEDLLAWALYKQGRYAEAREASMRALAQGTEDAQLYYHAGMIDRAVGDTANARAHLDRALQLNPFFNSAHTVSPLRASAS
ncbi:MAG: hypothetical protein JWL95_2180 [Gemmatimonadetes bacterium]|nr:hypothetical protein [Gemmatimonadota bacterium]